jgi:hypothetical protein
MVFAAALLTAAPSWSQPCGADGSDCVQPVIQSLSFDFSSCSALELDCLTSGLPSSNQWDFNPQPNFPGGFQDSSYALQAHSDVSQWLFDTDPDSGGGMFSSVQSYATAFGVGSTGMSAGVAYQAAGILKSPAAGWSELHVTPDLVVESPEVNTVIASGANPGIGQSYSLQGTLDWSGVPAGRDISLSLDQTAFNATLFSAYGTTGGRSITGYVEIGGGAGIELDYSRAYEGSLVTESAFANVAASGEQVASYYESRDDHDPTQGFTSLRSDDGMTYSLTRQSDSSSGTSFSDEQAFWISARDYITTFGKEYTDLGIYSNSSRETLDSNSGSFSRTNTTIQASGPDDQGGSTSFSDQQISTVLTSDGYHGVTNQGESGILSSGQKLQTFNESDVVLTHSESNNSTTAAEQDNVSASGVPTFSRFQVSSESSLTTANEQASSRFDDFSRGMYQSTQGTNYSTQGSAHSSALQATGGSSTSGGVETDTLSQQTNVYDSADRTVGYDNHDETGFIRSGIDVPWTSDESWSDYSFHQDESDSETLDQTTTLTAGSNGPTTERSSHRTFDRGGLTIVQEDYGTRSNYLNTVNHYVTFNGEQTEVMGQSQESFLSWTDSAGGHSKSDIEETGSFGDGSLQSQSRSERSSNWDSEIASSNLYIELGTYVQTEALTHQENPGRTLDLHNIERVTSWSWNYDNSGTQYGGWPSLPLVFMSGYYVRGVGQGTEDNRSTDAKLCVGSQCNESILTWDQSISHENDAAETDYGSTWFYRTVSVGDTTSLTRGRLGTFTDGATGESTTRTESMVNVAQHGVGASYWGVPGLPAYAETFDSRETTVAKDSTLSSSNGDLNDFTENSSLTDDRTIVSHGDMGDMLELTHSSMLSYDNHFNHTLNDYKKVFSASDGTDSLSITLPGSIQAASGWTRDRQGEIDYNDHRLNTPPVASLAVNGTKHTDGSQSTISRGPNSGEVDASANTIFDNAFSFVTAANGTYWGNSHIALSSMQSSITSGLNLTQRTVNSTDITNSDANGSDWYHYLSDKTMNFVKGKLMSVVSYVEEWGNRALLSMIKSQGEIQRLQEICGKITADNLAKGYDPSPVLPYFAQVCLDPALPEPQVCLEPMPGNGSANGSPEASDPRNAQGWCKGWSRS